MKFLTNAVISFTFLWAQATANIVVELDVDFRDSTVQCNYMYVTRYDAIGGNNYMLAVFDSISFNRFDRVSLFYNVNETENNMLFMVDTHGTRFKSNSFTVSPHSSAFAVVVEQQKISITKINYLIDYFYKLLILMFVEYLLVAVIGRKSVSALRAAVIVLIANIAGFGIITVIYILHTFW